MSNPILDLWVWDTITNQYVQVAPSLKDLFDHINSVVTTAHDPLFKGYRETTEIEEVTGNRTLNYTNANVFSHTLAGNVVYSLTAPPTGVAISVTLLIHQGSTVRTVTFPSSVKWAGDKVPDLSTANKTYVLTFVTTNGGTTWLGMLAGDF